MEFLFKIKESQETKNNRIGHAVFPMLEKPNHFQEYVLISSINIC